MKLFDITNDTALDTDSFRNPYETPNVGILIIRTPELLAKFIQFTPYHM